MTSEVIGFIVVFAAAVLFFGWSCYRRFGLVLKGRPDNRFDAFFKRIGNMLFYAFGQRRVVSKPFGINHFVLFWAFMVLLIANAEFLLNGLAPDVISYSRLPDGAYFTLACIFDIVSVLALLSVILAVIRRLTFPPPHTEARSLDAFVILSMVGFLMIAFFGMHASEIARGTERAADYMFISNFGASIIPSGASAGSLETAAEVFWWIHAVVLLAFLNYLPYSKKNGPKDSVAALPLIGGDGEGSVSEEVLWECTTCGACMEVCPVFIEHVPRIVDMRRNLVEMKAKFPEELLTLFENMEQRSNPWGIAPAERTKWAADINVQPFEAGKTEYLFYIGCAGAFDARNRPTTLSVAKILDAGGVSWGTLGRDELCCGESLRRLGNEYVFDRMARENIKMFEEKGVRKIITQCPHCYSTLKNDYRQYGVDLEVVHHTEFINSLVKEVNS
ncbi:hypothetical protein ES703_65855 [subsurface metagenome]